MAGDGRVRHCTLCDLNVYNFAAMTRDEVRELLTRTEGRVCARLYRRADGTLLTKDCPTGLRALRRRVSRSMSALAAALLSVATLVSGCAIKSRFQKAGSTIKLEIERVEAPQSAMLAGVVLFDDGSPLPGVTVKMRDEASGRELLTVTDVSGQFSIGSLQEGLYRVEVSLIGLEPAVLKHVALKQDEVARARVTLRFDTTIETVTVGGIAVEPTMMNTGVSTTFSQELINKLPLK
jgi:hypothetical protein